MTAPPRISNPGALAGLLARAVECLNTDRVTEAETALTRAIADHGDVPQAKMLLGVVRLKQNRLEEAKSLLENVLRAHPDQPSALFYLGDVQRALGDLAAALRSYGKALSARPHYTDAALGLAFTLRLAGDLEEAERRYRQIIARAPDMLAALAGLGETLVQRQEYDQAEQILEKAERLASDTDIAADIAESLGTAKMRQRRFAEALPHLERALALRPASIEAQRKRAIVLEHLNQPERAAAAYREVLKRQPEDLKTHLLLNELIHRAGPPGDMLSSYDEASRRNPASGLLPAAKADQLLLLGKTEEAAEAYRRALRLDPTHLQARIGLGRALDRLGETKSATEAFETGLKLHPENPAIKTAFAFHLLQQADAGKAKQLAEAAVLVARHDQAALAVLGLCFRATGDARDDALNDYDRFVRVFDLEPPENYADIAEFHRDLRGHLDMLHAQAGQFFSQTLRGGTRAGEGIFEFRQRMRDQLRSRIAEAVNRFIADMPRRPEHPFLGRRESGAFQFSGSWSSRMKGGGFHVNHIHDGWISSVYYVDVPDAAADTTGRQGWLKFGEPSAELTFQDAIRKTVQPKPGRLVLFPSYMWHGTIPFHSDEVRTTIAFDAIPHRAS
jgi:tetratricopeptide (TPR) repeat protein